MRDYTTHIRCQSYCNHRSTKVGARACMNLQALELSAANRPEFLPEEALLFVQDGVGLYEGKIKLPAHQNGHVYLTSHRICFVDNIDPRKNSIALPLKGVDRFEHYAGFLKSSPKVTLFPKITRSAAFQTLGQSSSDPGLGRSPPRSSSASPFPRNGRPSAAPARSQTVTWICPICSYSNTLPPGFDVTVASEQTSLPPCKTCGIKPPLAHLLKAAISTATVKLSSDVSETSNISTSSKSSGHSDSQTQREARRTPGPSHVCPRCTFENHPSLQSCEMCGASLALAHVYEPSLENLSVRVDSPGPDATQGTETDRSDCVKVSFRSGGDKTFAERLRSALTQRKWLSDHAPPIPQPFSAINELRSNPGSGSQTPEPSGVGIAGLERRGLERRRNNENVISNAFEDLEALMASAQDIINLAESFADKSTNTSATEVIHDAVLNMSTTKDMLSNGTATSESLYLSQLSRELAEYLTNEQVGALRRSGGIMSLVDLWAEFNARRNGVELISPSDLEKAVRLWEKLTLRVRLRMFRNGLLVVQQYDHTDDKTIAQILAWLQELRNSTSLMAGKQCSCPWDVHAFGRGVTPLETAEHFGWSVGVAVEELEMVEEHGMLCREEGIEGLRFWENRISSVD